VSLGGKLVRAWVALIAIAALLGALASTGVAKGGGQLESWGAKGTADGQFFNPGMMGVDPSTGTVYTGDLSSDKKNFRLQQFSPTGELKAVGTTPRFSGEALLFMHGIAVDPVLERFYVVEGCRVNVGVLTPCKKTGGVFGAKQILVFSTKPEGGKLVADKTTPTIPLPSGENELYLPQSIAVDPSTHDLVILAEDATHHPVVQRFSSAGVAGNRFVDSEKKLRPSGAETPVAVKDATSVVVSPAGVSYTMTGNQLIQGATRAWQLPPTLATVEPVPGFAAAAESEKWVAPMAGKPESTIGGNQIAISSDGSTLYWKEMATESELSEAGNMLVRGFSLTSNATASLWGEGTSTCKITTTGAGMAAAPGNKLVVFDYGPISDSPSYGVKVLTFGPGGTGCPEPKAKFTVNGKKESEEPTGIKPGDTVSFDAASSELFGGFRRELIWKFGDGTEKVVKFTPGLEGEADKEAVTTISHLYSSTAKVTVRLEIKLNNANLGSPDPVERSFNVGTPAAGQKLTVTKSGTGSGTVTSSPSGISCGATCEAEFEAGKEVTLTPSPAPGSEFKGWSGACSGTGACKVAMSAAKSVGAQFGLIPEFKLKVVKAGSGGGTVTSIPFGINCGVACEVEFEEGTVVTLSASPDPGSQFTGWSGAGCSGTGTCEVTMSAAKEATATFTAEPHLLTVAKSGTGSGTVSSSPAGINCGSTCSASFAHNAEVTLTPTPAAGSEFKGWSGACTGSGACKVTMSAAKSVGAEFALVPTFKLTVTKSGTGTGTVTSSPSGINCGAICEAEFETGKEVTLTPAASAGSEFKGWSGACSGAGTCKVTMSAAKSVTAEFALEQHQLTVTKSGNGSGTVTSAPAGITCGATCSASFTHNVEVTLTPAATGGSEFKGWSGACSGTGTCKVTMSAAKSVGAEFALELHLLTVTKSGNGSGTVTSAPAGITCGATCSVSFNHNVEVTLTPAASAGSEFKGWSGACSGTGTCKVTMSAAKSVGAEFAIEQRLLTVSKSGSGGGTVSSSPAGIDCGSTCEAPFNLGTEVTLAPSPAGGSEFKGWSGACSGTGTCKVTISAAKSVTAEFALVPGQVLLTVNKVGNGSGTVTSAPAGINCGSTCEAGFTEGTNVTLQGVAGANTKAVVWSGCTEIVGSNECKVAMSAAKEVTATFTLEKHALTVAKSGPGSGTVTSAPAGINCGSTCSAEFNGGEEVELAPAPTGGSKFVKWTGACSGSGVCKVTMSAAKSVTAEFALIPNFKLKVIKAGSGSGTVTSTPAGINCGSTCEAEYEEGKAVTLTAAPAAGSQFTGWSGSGCAGTGACEVTMSAAKEVTATFTLEQHQLTVTKSGTGTGSVSSSPAGINCGTTCSASFAHNAEVTLTPTPAAGSEFKGWSGACSGTGTCKVTISAAASVTAEFATEQHTLTVTKSGSGSGTVSSAPSGITCGATCVASFDHNVEVTLTPAASAGSEFKGWSGACSGTGTCKVTMSAAKSIGAEFALIPGHFQLKVLKAGNGSGTVTSTPAGITCGATCEAEYEEGKAVTLSVGPAAGSQFTGWSGAGCSGTGSCEVTMSAAKEVTATFTLEQHQLTVTKSGTGSGTVTSTPAGIECGPTCSAGFAHNTEVTLTPSPAAGSELRSWSGACSGTGTCKVMMSAAKAVTAEFALIPGHFQLEVTKSGAGSGTVTSSPAGIDCGPTCEAEYEEGKAVTLSAAPAAGSRFTGWSGSGCSGTGSCEVTMSAAKEVTATFTLEQHTLTMTKSGTGAGSVSSSPAGIECGATCWFDFDHGTEVTLTPSPAAGSEFKGWSGACTGSGACKVTMSAAKEVTAVFDLVATPPPTENPTAEVHSGESGPRFSNNGPGGGNRLEMPVTIAGPSSDIVDFGGVAMAPDASGGVVYTKTVEGVPHVFAHRYVDGRWSAPIRVDGDVPYEGTQPRITAGRKGELLVVWVSEVATVAKRIRYGLFSAKIGRGASEFGPSQLVDPDVGDGIGVEPSLSATAPSQAIVAYRVITFTFDGSKPSTAVQLRPGDVMAEIRVARLKEDRWARLGAMNGNPAISMRPPTATNGPKVGAGVDGGAVVAWQEPDQSGTARILMRRIFGTVPGQVLQASPTTLGNAPVSGDVDAFSLAVTPLDQARIAMRLQPNSAGGRARLLLNTLPAGYVVPSNDLLGAQSVFTAESPAANAIGSPGVAAYEKGGKEGQLRLSFVTGNQLRQMAVDKGGSLVGVSAPAGPAPVPGADSVAALDPGGGGVVAYPALTDDGSQALSVRQEFANGAAQTGLLSGLQDGPIAGLAIGSSGSGDALIGFRQGKPGAFQVVVERVSARPAAFKVKGPKKWTKPTQVKLKWEASQSNAGLVTYSVLVGGRVVTRGLRKLSFRLRPATLGTGRKQARVLATDGAGQQLLSKRVKLLIDGDAPAVKVDGGPGGVTVRVDDPDSGVKKKNTWVSFGDGSSAGDASRFRHVYERAGRYAVVVHAGDRVGNRVVRRFEVRTR
jgi:hypothetical protein